MVEKLGIDLASAPWGRRNRAIDGLVKDENAAKKVILGVDV